MCESVTTDRSENQRVELGISREPLVEATPKPVVTVELVEQLGDDARAECINALDIPLRSQTAGCGSL